MITSPFHGILPVTIYNKNKTSASNCGACFSFDIKANLSSALERLNSIELLRRDESSKLNDAYKYLKELNNCTQIDQLIISINQLNLSAKLKLYLVVKMCQEPEFKEPELQEELAMLIKILHNKMMPSNGYTPHSSRLNEIFDTVLKIFIGYLDNRSDILSSVKNNIFAMDNFNLKNLELKVLNPKNDCCNNEFCIDDLKAHLTYKNPWDKKEGIYEALFNATIIHTDITTQEDTSCRVEIELTDFGVLSFTSSLSEQDLKKIFNNKDSLAEIQEQLYLDKEMLKYALSLFTMNDFYTIFDKGEIYKLAENIMNLDRYRNIPAI